MAGRIARAVGLYGSSVGKWKWPSGPHLSNQISHKLWTTCIVSNTVLFSWISFSREIINKPLISSPDELKNKLTSEGFPRDTYDRYENLYWGNYVSQIEIFFLGSSMDTIYQKHIKVLEMLEKFWSILKICFFQSEIRWKDWEIFKSIYPKCMLRTQLIQR